MSHIITSYGILTPLYLSGSTDNVAWEARGQITVDIKGTGSFTFVLDLYEDSEFVKKRDSSQYPVRLSVQDDIYLEVRISSSFIESKIKA